MAFFPELQYNAPKINTPFENAGQLSQIQQAQNQNQLAQYTLHKSAREDSQQNALASLYQNATGADGTIDYSKMTAGAAQGGNGALIQGILKQKNDAAMSSAKLNKTQLEGKQISSNLSQQERVQAAQRLGGLRGQPYEAVVQDMTSGLQDAVQAGKLTPEEAQQKHQTMLQKIPRDQEGLNAFIDSTVMSVMAPDKQYEAYRPKVERANLGGSTALIDQNPNSPTFGKVLSGYGNTASPDAKLRDSREHDSVKDTNKPPAGYRFLPNGNLEQIPGGPADQKTQTRLEGGGTVDSVIAGLRDHYNKLDEAGGITNPNKSTLSNISAYASSSGLGQAFGKIVGTENQSDRNSILQQRPILLQAIMKATGMSSKQMDSNTELKLYLSTATDPTLDVAANKRALDMIEKLYGSASGGKQSANASQNGATGRAYLSGATTQADFNNRVKALQAKGWTEQQIRAQYGN